MKNEEAQTLLDALFDSIHEPGQIYAFAIRDEQTGFEYSPEVTVTRGENYEGDWSICVWGTDQTNRPHVTISLAPHVGQDKGDSLYDLVICYDFTEETCKGIETFVADLSIKARKSLNGYQQCIYQGELKRTLAKKSKVSFKHP